MEFQNRSDTNGKLTIILIILCFLGTSDDCQVSTHRPTQYVSKWRIEGALSTGVFAIGECHVPWTLKTSDVKFEIAATTCTQSCFCPYPTIHTFEMPVNNSSLGWHVPSHFYIVFVLLLNLFASWICITYLSVAIKQQKINQSAILRFHHSWHSPSVVLCKEFIIQI
jgi:hypothetical protein